MINKTMGLVRESMRWNCWLVRMRMTGVMWSGDAVDCRLYFHTTLSLSSWHINGFRGSRQRASTYVIPPWPWPAAQYPMAMAAAAIFDICGERESTVLPSPSLALPITSAERERRGRDAASIIYYNNATINKYYPSITPSSTSLVTLEE